MVELENVYAFRLFSVHRQAEAAFSYGTFPHLVHSTPINTDIQNYLSAREVMIHVGEPPTPNESTPDKRHLSDCLNYGFSCDTQQSSY